MRRNEIVDGVQAIKTAINQSEILETLRQLMNLPPSARKEATNEDLIASLKSYIVAAQSYNSAAKQIAEVFGLTHLESPSVWADLLYGKDSATIYQVFSTVRFAHDYVPRLQPLLEQEPFREIGRDIEGGASKYKGMRVLTITLYEDKKSFSSPSRVANAIESINHFYYVCAMMNNESPSTISVIAFDSGSDKSVDFLGLAKLMECVERILNNIWERVFFFREHQLEERLDLVAKSLPIIKQISEMKEHNELAPELAELLNQNIFEGVNKFVQSGVSTPEIENTSNYNPRALLSPVQRLLVSAPEGERMPSEDTATSVEAGDKEPKERVGKKADAGEINFNNLSPEVQEALRRLIEQASSAPPAASADVIDVTNATDTTKQSPAEDE